MSTNQEAPISKNEQWNIELILQEVAYKKESEILYLDLISKLILYSSGIITTSITGFIALSNKWNISDLKYCFILIVLFWFITILSGLLTVLFCSKQKDIQSNIVRNSRKVTMPWRPDVVKIIDTEMELDKECSKWKKLACYSSCIAMASFVLSIASSVWLFLLIKP